MFLLHGRLFFCQLSCRLERVDLRNRLVRADAHDPGETHREPAVVPVACLDTVKRYLQHNFWRHFKIPAVLANGSL